MKRLVFCCVIMGLVVGLIGWAQPASAIDGGCCPPGLICIPELLPCGTLCCPPGALCIPELPRCCGDTSGPRGTDVPCACGDMVTTTTVLNSSDPVTRTVCPARGLSVKAGVSLNLANTTLRGVCGGGAGLSIAPGPKTIIKGGHLLGFETGVYGAGVTDSVVSFLEVRDSCFQGMFLEQSNRNLIEQNSFDGNNRCALLVEGDENTVRLNHATENALGICVEGLENVVSQNIANRNDFVGFGIGGADALVELNQANFNESGPGFDITGTHHEIRRNIARDNGGDGFHILATDTLFDQNTANYNGRFGFHEVNPPQNNTYRHNRCTPDGAIGSSPPGLCR